MRKISCLPYRHLANLGHAGILRYVADCLILEFDTYLDLDFFDTQIVNVLADEIRVVLKKSFLFLPKDNASYQKFEFLCRNGQAKIQFDLRANPLLFKGFPDCLNEIGEREQVLNVILNAMRQKSLGELNLHDPNEHNYVTILDNATQYDVFITREQSEGRYSISKKSGEIFAVMHTQLRKKRPFRLPSMS